MPNVVKLGEGAIKAIHAAIDELFDRAKVRFLGPQSILGKRIYVSYEREKSLPGIFEAGHREEGGNPDLDVLNGLLGIAGGYLDAVRERTKARVVNEINGSLMEARHRRKKLDREEFRALVNGKLADVYGDITNHVNTIVDTEVSKVKNFSVLEGIMRANAYRNIEDPVVYFVVVRDNLLCDECKALHLLPGGRIPRLWYLSEVSHGYHKKGDETPSIGGLHPHCRCTMVTLMPGYYFDPAGMVKFHSHGFNGIEHQRGFDKSESLQKTEAEEKVIVTPAGTRVKRSRIGVGKDIGGEIYLHRNYEDHIPDQQGLKNAKKLLKKKYPDFKYNALKFNKHGKFTFFDSPDFDTAHEPVAGKYVNVNIHDKSAKDGETNKIWHHKWLWVKDDYIGFNVPESFERSKKIFNIPNINRFRIGDPKVWAEEYAPLLNKAEGGRKKFDPGEHPRDPETGRFIDHDKAFVEAIERGPKYIQREWNEATQKEQLEWIAHAERVMAVAYLESRELYDELVQRPYLARGIPLDAEGHLADPTDPDEYGPPLDILKGEVQPDPNTVTPIFEDPKDTRTEQLFDMLRREIAAHKASGTPLKLLNEDPIQTLNGLLFGYKYHSNGRLGQLAKYLAHREHYFDDYLEGLDEAAELDKQFDVYNNHLRERRGGIRGTQQRKDAGLPVVEKSFPAIQLKSDLGFNIHLFDQMLHHRKALQERLLREGKFFPGGEGEPRILLARSFKHPEPQKHRMLSSFSDDLESARPDPFIGSTQKHRFFYAVPVSAVLANYHHAGIFSFAHPYRTSEHEWLVLPHKEQIIPEEVALQHFKEIIPPPPSGTSGRKAMEAIPDVYRDKEGKVKLGRDQRMIRPMEIATAKPPKVRKNPNLRMSEDD